MIEWSSESFHCSHRKAVAKVWSLMYNRSWETVLHLPESTHSHNLYLSNYSISITSSLWKQEAARTCRRNLLGDTNHFLEQSFSRHIWLINAIHTGDYDFSDSKLISWTRIFVCVRERDTYAASIWTSGSTAPVVLDILALRWGLKNPECRCFSSVVDALPAVWLM